MVNVFDLIIIKIQKDQIWQADQIFYFLDIVVLQI